MIHFITGNLLESQADCLVNTVNCEGYMGKGIAYQFKLKYPNNNKDYVKACKTKSLVIGKLHYFLEDNKVIINFPTKDKWRQKSKIEYITSGLDELLKILPQLKIKSIAIPPLGCGNGGLEWKNIKTILIEKFTPVENVYEILIYEPSKSYISIPKKEPKLYLSHLVLMNIKFNLNKFNKVRLQKTCFFLDVFSDKNYFKFKKGDFGPYDNNISILSRQISEFQSYHNITDTKKAYELAYKELISKKYNEKLNNLKPLIYKACEYVNKIEDNKNLEGIATTLFLIQNNDIKNEQQLIFKFKNWSKDKADRFSENDIKNALKYLLDSAIILESFTGYQVNDSNKLKILL